LAQTVRRFIETERQTFGSRTEKIQAARDRFYKGDIADELEKFYQANGGWLRKADLAAHITFVEDPITINYRGYIVCKCGPWTQGPYLLETLRLLEGFNLKSMRLLSPDYIHVVTEALKLGLADRDEYYGDPRFVQVPINDLLSDSYTKLRRELIDMQKASPDIRPGDPVALKAVKKKAAAYQPWTGGTTTCVTADRWGNMMAATPNGNPPYTVCQELGVSHATRLSSMNTTPGHPNRIEPGKRPRITLTPTLVLKDGKAIAAISVAGGDLQDQTTLNCLLNLIEFGLKPAEAVRQPRFSTGHHEDSFDSDPDRAKSVVSLNRLTLDTAIPEATRQALTQRGHNIITTDRPIAKPVMIYRDPETGLIYAAGDPRGGRHAAVVNSSTN
jgi:gamma-glutamyltranspeptidase / glutathione hydrolase